MATSLNVEVLNVEEETCGPSNEKRWTDSRTDLLISILKTHPCLYNTSLKEYKNRDERKKAVEDMSKQLQVTESEIKAKLKSLRSTYSREKGKKKKKHPTGTGTDDIDIKTWKFFEAMRFIDDFVIPKATVSNLQEISTSNDEEDTDLLFDESEDQEKETVSTKRPLPFKKEKKTAKKAKEEKEDILINKAIECMEKSAAKPSDLDEHDIFGKYVAHELRGIPNVRLQKWIKWNIQNTLYSVQFDNRQQYTFSGHPPPPCGSQFSSSMSPQSSSEYDSV